MAVTFVAVSMEGSRAWHPADAWFLSANAEALGAAASYYYIFPCKCFSWDVLSCKALCHFSTSASSAFVFSLNIFVVSRCYCWHFCVFPKLKVCRCIEFFFFFHVFLMISFKKYHTCLEDYCRTVLMLLTKLLSNILLRLCQYFIIFYKESVLFNWLDFLLPIKFPSIFK